MGLVTVISATGVAGSLGSLGVGVGAGVGLPVEPEEPPLEPDDPPVEPDEPPEEPEEPPLEPDEPPVEPDVPPLEPEDPPVEPDPGTSHAPRAGDLGRFAADARRVLGVLAHADGLTPRIGAPVRGIIEQPPDDRYWPLVRWHLDPGSDLEAR